jgi:hypothetical protein
MCSAVLRIRIRTDPHHLAGSGILEVDPDPRLQYWHLINLFSIEKYRYCNKFKYMYANSTLFLTEYRYRFFFSIIVLSVASVGIFKCGILIPVKSFNFFFF